MPDELNDSNHYAATLAELRTQREKLRTQCEKVEVAIGALEALSGQPLLGAPTITINPSIPTVDDPGAFLGRSITDAAKILLAARRRPLKNPEIAAAFKAGGLHLKSKDPVNTVGAVLTRRSQEVGDIVKIGRGVWGLREWYPGRSFKKGNADNGAKTEVETLKEEAI
jgi:hypothetical protein